MKVLFTGATGVLGRAAIPVLVAAGHDVTGVSRSVEDQTWLDRVGARPQSLDLFDPESVLAAAAGVDAIVHYATAIPHQSQMPKREAWATNDRLRDEATGILVDAALATGVGRFVQQSVTFFYADGGARWLDESAEVSPSWDVLDSALAAEKHVARFTEGGGRGVVLRLARVYGPGRASGELVAAVAKRKLPMIGRGANFVSSIHVVDAATALVAALTGPAGTYNVTDDEPVTSADYMTSLAGILGAPKPRRIPKLMARMALGKATGLLTTSHRISNKRLRTEAGWQPTFSSVREGWHDVVGHLR